MPRSDAPRPAERSWWLEEALALPEFAGPEAPPLEGDTTADVVILGGGYTGMWTAWFLKERQPDLDVVLLETDICGGGPSGRNGGFCDGWWEKIRDVRDTYGDGDAIELLMTCGRAPTEIGTWCRANGVDAWFRHGGDLAVATNERHEGAWEGSLEAARALSVEDEFQILTAGEVQHRCASPRFGSGVLIADAATVHPARLARGLRRLLIENGVRIFERTTVTRLGMGARVTAETPSGSVRAGDAVVGLGAWATWWRSFRPRLTLRGSYMVVTAGPEARRSGTCDRRSTTRGPRPTAGSRSGSAACSRTSPGGSTIGTTTSRSMRDAWPTTCIGCSRASTACRSTPRGEARST